MKIRHILMVWILVMAAGKAWAAGDEHARYAAGFKNFLTCELTRTSAISPFNGKAFAITMIRLHNIRPESGMRILTGAIQCSVSGEYKTLYAALGVKKLEDRQVVAYYTLRKTDFSILATELMTYPYKERCPWARYWVDTD